MKYEKRKNGHFVFSILLIIFFSPLILAIILFYKNPLWLYKKTTNKGQLTSSGLNLHQIKLIQHKAKLGSLNNTWFLFYLTTSHHNPLFDKNLHTMRQVTLALGKNRYRVKYGLIQTNEKSIHTYSFTNNDPHLLNYTISKGELKKFFLALKIKEHVDAFYLADPFGKVILYYPSYASGKDIYQDLTRLLTISTTG